jgi:hypothetical protein
MSDTEIVVSSDKPSDYCTTILNNLHALQLLKFQTINEMDRAIGRDKTLIDRMDLEIRNQENMAYSACNFTRISKE